MPGRVGWCQPPCRSPGPVALLPSAAKRTGRYFRIRELVNRRCQLRVTLRRRPGADIVTIVTCHTLALAPFRLPPWQPRAGRAPASSRCNEEWLPRDTELQTASRKRLTGSNRALPTRVTKECCH